MTDALNDLKEFLYEADTFRASTLAHDHLKTHEEVLLSESFLELRRLAYRILDSKV